VVGLVRFLVAVVRARESWLRMEVENLMSFFVVVPRVLWQDVKSEIRLLFYLSLLLFLGNHEPGTTNRYHTTRLVKTMFNEWYFAFDTGFYTGCTCGFFLSKSAIS
jgi:hypothetical protein